MRTVVTVMAAVALVGCAAREPLPKWPVSSPAEVCDDPALGPEDFCMPGARVERLFETGQFIVEDAVFTPTGATRPYKLLLRVPGGRRISAKFKRATGALEAVNNSPRRELAAYELQKMFLDEKDYVVPPTVLVCLPVQKHMRLMPDLEPTAKTDCAVGILAYWVEGLTAEGVLDDERWERDVEYRYHLGNVNVLSVLVGHQDDLGDNFLISTDLDEPRVIAIDNGIAFGALGVDPLQWFSSGWSDLHVTALPRRTVARLRRLDRAMLDKLLVVGQLELQHGSLVRVPPTAPIDPNLGVRTRGRVIQLGLTAEEITDVQLRLVKLLGQVGEGAVVAAGG